MSGYCDIAPGHPLHGPYHDHEYGFPQREEAALFERLLLEINQAGLSWETISCVRTLPCWMSILYSLIKPGFHEQAATSAEETATSNRRERRIRNSGFLIRL